MSKIFGRYETFTIDINNFSWHLEGGWGGDYVPPALSGNFINNIDISKHGITFNVDESSSVFVELAFNRDLSMMLFHEDEQVYGNMIFHNISLYTPWQDGHFVNWEDYKSTSEKSQFEQLEDCLRGLKEIVKGCITRNITNDFGADVYHYMHMSHVDIPTGEATCEDIVARMYDNRKHAYIRITNVGPDVYKPFMIQVFIEFDEEGKITDFKSDGLLCDLKEGNPADKLMVFINKLNAERKNNQ